MMRLGNNKNTNVDIDLTSMLDVIFIVLMVVMCCVGAGRQSYEELSTKNTELNDQLDEANNQLKSYQDMVEAQDNLDEEVAIIVLHADYDADNPADREMWLLRSTSEGEEELGPDHIPLNNESREEAFLQIEQRITDYLDGNEGIPVLIRVDTERILYRDYNQLDAMLTKLQEERKNLFCTYKAD